MTEPQIWTMIGAVIALMFGMLTVVSTLFVRVLRAEIGGVNERIGGLRVEMVSRFETVDARIDSVNTRIDGLEHRIDGLDRDVRALVKHTFGLDRD